MAQFKYFILSSIFAVLLLGVSGCREPGPAERTGRDIDRATEDAGRSIEDFGRDVRDTARGD